MSGRARLALALATPLLAASCVAGTGDTTTSLGASTSTSSPPSTTSTATSIATTTTLPGLVSSLPACDAGVSIPASGPAEQVAFISGDVAYVVEPDGRNVQCLGEVTATEPFVWGPAGDRLVIGESVITTDVLAKAPEATRPTWSRPTGTSLVWVQGGRLLKAGADGTGLRDLSFLDTHDDVTYHPAGVEIATTGVAAGGVRGVWLSSNEGTDPRLIVRSEDATVHEFTFNHEGASARFLADHGDEWHVHDIFLVLPDEDPAANEFEATIELTSPGPLSNLAVSPWDGLWAVREGACGSGSSVVIQGTPPPVELAGVDAYPVGWLPDQRLVVAALPDGCDAPLDLWILDVEFDEGSAATLLMAGVEGAAVRATVPDPPPPLGDVSLDDFA